MTDRNALRRATYFLEAEVDCWQSLFNEGDQELARDFKVLMIKLYRYHDQKKPMYKMDACRFIPVKHAASAKKYIDQAEERGLISFVSDPTDKRRTIVQPSQELLDLVEKHLIRSIELRPGIGRDSDSDGEPQRAPRT